MKYLLLAFTIMTCSLNAHPMSHVDKQALIQLVADLESFDFRIPYDENRRFNFFCANENTVQQLIARMNRFLNTHPDSRAVQNLAEIRDNFESAINLIRTAPARVA